LTVAIRSGEMRYETETHTGDAQDTVMILFGFSTLQKVCRQPTSWKRMVSKTFNYDTVLKQVNDPGGAMT
jgi:hypothetical protein